MPTSPIWRNLTALRSSHPASSWGNCPAGFGEPCVRLDEFLPGNFIWSKGSGVQRHIVQIDVLPSVPTAHDVVSIDPSTPAAQRRHNSGPLPPLARTAF